MSVQDDFAKAKEDVMTLSKQPSKNDMLDLYCLYKQGTEGDVKGSRPGMLDPIGRAKYDGRAKFRGLSKEAAMQKYIDKVKALMKSDRS